MVVARQMSNSWRVKNWLLRGNITAYFLATELLRLSLSLLSTLLCYYSGWSCKMERISSSSTTMTNSISQPHQAIKYVALAQEIDIIDDNSEKAVSGKKRPPVLGRLSSPVFSASAPSTVTEWTPYSYSPDSTCTRSQPATTASRFSRNTQSPHRSSHSRSTQSPTSSDMMEMLRPWIPLVLYALTSLAFVVAFALYRDELFTCTLTFFYPIIIHLHSNSYSI